MDDAGTAGAPEKLEFADEPQASLSTATTVTEPPPQAPKTDAIKEEPKKRKTLLGHAWDFSIEMAKILAIVLLLRAYVVQASSVEGHSMEGTLHDKDLLLVERLSMSLVNGPEWLKAVMPDAIMPELERGDIVVLTSPENGNNELVKRVIAIEGDYIFFYTTDGQVWINGALMDESYLSPDVLKDLGKNSRGQPRHFHRDDVDRMPNEFRIDADEFKEAQRNNRLNQLGARVPKGCVFVMGDNRRQGSSNDSRAWAGIDVNNGPEIGNANDRSNYLWVTTKSIHGRVIARLLPPWQYNDQYPVFPR